MSSVPRACFGASRLHSAPGRAAIVSGRCFLTGSRAGDSSADRSVGKRSTMRSTAASRQRSVAPPAAQRSRRSGMTLAFAPPGVGSAPSGRDKRVAEARRLEPYAAHRGRRDRRCRDHARRKDDYEDGCNGTAVGAVPENREHSVAAARPSKHLLTLTFSARAWSANIFGPGRLRRVGGSCSRILFTIVRCASVTASTRPRLIDAIKNFSVLENEGDYPLHASCWFRSLSLPHR